MTESRIDTPEDLTMVFRRLEMAEEALKSLRQNARITDAYLQEARDAARDLRYLLAHSGAPRDRWARYLECLEKRCPWLEEPHHVCIMSLP